MSQDNHNNTIHSITFLSNSFHFQAADWFTQDKLIITPEAIKAMKLMAIVIFISSFIIAHIKLPNEFQASSCLIQPHDQTQGTSVFNCISHSLQAANEVPIKLNHHKNKEIIKIIFFIFFVK